MRRQSSRGAAVLAALCAALCAARVWAGDDVTEMSLEQLMNEPVTSVSKRETKLSASAAAIAVVTHEDMRRLGITTLPDALRLVPGLDVAQISSNQWAVSSRGFNGEFANKLLVLIDGRSIYTPASGGVFWNAQDIMIEDIDRIEVIRGPGATLWGANAVNGVINIITKRAEETEGILASATEGTDLSRYAARYGGTLGPDFSFRTYLQYHDNHGFTDSTRRLDTGAWEALRSGFRVDGEPSAADTLTVQGDAYGGHASNTVTWASLTPPGNATGLATENNTGANVLARWTHSYAANSTLTLQSFFDHTVQGDGEGIEHRDVYDVDVQHRFLLGGANDVLWGAGFRQSDVVEEPHSFAIAWSPSGRDIQESSAFVQDEVTLVPDRIRTTVGIKFEHTDFAGSNALPNLRIGWTPDERQTIWAAVSRAAATPSVFDLDGRDNVSASRTPNGTPMLFSVLPNPSLTSEELLAYELGYRFTPSPVLSLDLSSFVNHYRHLIVDVGLPAAFELSPAPPHVLIAIGAQNALSAATHGLEASAHCQPLPNWQLTASYTWLQIDADSMPAIEQQSPRQQFQVRSYLDLPLHLELNAALYYVDAVSAPAGPVQIDIPPYVRADAGLLWKGAGGWSFGVWGQNLAQRDHAEFTSLRTAVLGEVPRSAIAMLVWTF